MKSKKLVLFVVFVVKFPGYFDNPIQRPQRLCNCNMFLPLCGSHSFLKGEFLTLNFELLKDLRVHFAVGGNFKKGGFGGGSKKLWQNAL